MTYPWPDGPVQPGPWQPRGAIAVADSDLAGEPWTGGIDLDREYRDDAHPITVTTVGCGTCGADALMPGDLCCGYWTPAEVTR